MFEADTIYSYFLPTYFIIYLFIMAWKNVKITHFPNIWMKRLSCLQYSKIRG